MKIILNQDVKHLGEMGDVKNVANGYYRNYLFPHGLAVPYNDVTVAYFESRKEEIEARKEQKRKDSASLKEKLEALNVELVVELLHKDALFKSPARRIFDGVDIPAFRDNAILDDTRVRDQRVDTIAHHHRCRVTVMNGCCRVRFLFRTRQHHEQRAHAKEVKYV